jgi:hypothetical protein
VATKNAEHSSIKSVGIAMSPTSSHLSLEAEKMVKLLSSAQGRDTLMQEMTVVNGKGAGRVMVSTQSEAEHHFVFDEVSLCVYAW